MIRRSLRNGIGGIAGLLMLAFTASAPGQSSLQSDAAGNLRQVSAVIPASGVNILPLTLVVKPGESARFNAFWATQPGDTVTWSKNGSPIANQSGDALVIPAVGSTDEGDYTVTVVTSAGTFTSPSAHLYFDSDSDGLGDAWEILRFGNLNRIAGEDTDGDGVTNAEEFEDGTLPNSIGSRNFQLSLQAINGRIFAEPSSATGRYPAGTVVKLRAVPHAGWVFSHWSGGVSSFLPELSLAMNAHRSLQANFREPTTLAAASSAPLTWTTGGDLPWTAQSQATAPEGSSLVQSGAIGHSQESWIETTVTGPGIVSWWWKLSSDPGAAGRTGDLLRCEIDGQLIQQIGGEVSWRPISQTIGSGPHTIRWSFRRDATVSTGSNLAWLDRVAVSNVQPSLIAQAMDLPATANLLAGGSELWQLQTTVTHDGTDALKSPPILDDEEAWVETTVVGPGVISFWWKVSSDGTSSSDGMNFIIDGTVSNTIAGEQNWVRVEKYLNGMEHKLRWRYFKNHTATAGDDAGWLDEVTFTPSPTLEAALDQPALSFSSGGAATWFTETIAGSAHDGVDAARSGATTLGQESWLQTTVTGPGLLSFWWNVSSNASNFFEFFVDGEPYHAISGTPGWSQVTLTLPPGIHTLRWRYLKSVTTVTGADSGYLDEVTWQPGAPALAEAVESPGFGLQFIGSSPWASQSTTTHDGTDALQSGPLATAGMTSRVEGMVQGPGVISFWWKSSCASTTVLAHGLHFRCDDQTVLTINGERNWAQVQQIIPPGPHLLTWEFFRPTSSAGSNSAWLDEISFQADSMVPLATALDGAGLDWTSGGYNGSWSGFTSALAPDGVDLAASPPLGHSQFSWIETTVTGPGVIDCRWSLAAELDDLYYYQVDGDTIFTRAGNSAWVPTSSHLPAGPHKIRWHYAKDSSASESTDTAFLDAVNFTATATPPLMDAVDNLTLPLHGFSSPWTRQTTTIRDGSDAAQSGPIADLGNSYMRTQITGPGTLTYWWKVSCATGDALHFYQDGTSTRAISGTSGDWAQVTHAVPPGHHIYDWRYTKNGAGVAGSDAGWVDEIVFTPTTNSAMAAAVEIAATTPFFTGGSPVSVPTWQIQNTGTHDGVDVLKSPALADSQQSFFESVVEGPGVLSFWYKVSSEPNGDLLEFWLDDTQRLLFTSGEVDWKKFEVLLTPGAHRAYWRYMKDASAVSGQDAAWVDEVAVTPLKPLAAAADTSLVLSTGGVVAWEGQPMAGAQGDTSGRAASGLISAGQESWMETTVNGSGTFAFHWRTSSYTDGILRLIVDGVERNAISGILNWQEQIVTLTGGPHVIRWKFERATNNSNGDNRGYVDRISFTPAALSPLADGADLSASLSLASHGPGAWFRQTDLTHDGSDALRSGPVGPSEVSRFRMPVTGPGTVSFWWKVSSEYGSGFLRCFIGGVEQTPYITGWVDWEQRFIQVPAGAQEIEWYYARNTSTTTGGFDAGWLDEIVFTPAISIAAAVDSTGMTWTTGGNVPWAGLVEGSSDWASSGAIAANQQSWAETIITGPGTLNFDWAVSSSTTDFLSFTLDGHLISRRAGDLTAWTTRRQTLPPGMHTLRWTYAKDAATVAGADRGQLDAVTFTPQALPPLSDGVDAPLLTLGSQGAYPWVRDTITTHDGSDSLRSTATAPDTSSPLTTTLTGPGTISFWWKVSSHSSDILRFYIDDVERITGGIAGEKDWQKVDVYLDPGDHVLVWQYFMNNALAGGQNAAWVDEISYAPALTTPTLAAALDQPALSWSTGPEGRPWSGLATAAAWDGTDAAAVLDPSTDGPSWVETNITGPTTLTFRWRSDSGFQGKFLMDGVQQISTIQQATAWTLATQAIPAGVHTLRWEGAYYTTGPSPGSAGVWLDNVTVEGQGYSGWATGFALAGADADPMADFDKDGLANLLEFAFNLDPTRGNLPPATGNNGRVPVSRIEGSGADARLVVEFIRRQGGGLTYTPRFSDDFGAWTSVSGTPVVTDLGGGWELVKVPDLATVNDKKQRFASVIVTMP